MIAAISKKYLGVPLWGWLIGGYALSKKKAPMPPTTQAPPPTQAPPTQTAPTQTAPTQTAPTQTAPTQTAPANIQQNGDFWQQAALADLHKTSP